MMNSNGMFFVLAFSFLVNFTAFGQQTITKDELRVSAKKQIVAKKYGEAIDLLNKFISASPRDPEGYTLRGICFESIERYQNAVLDLRRALKLNSNYTVARTALTRTLEVWHKQLRKKIVGHKREIAIDPYNPFNYLEIGKSYRWLEEWQNAEDWYDKYLARDDNASSDEIIRYTEILAKNNHITKGEKILKKYVGRHPDDWRLWSRYGYFSLWLGKYAQAKNAFETALGFKPFFKQAEDGLDIVTRKAYLTQEDPRENQKEFPIDKYFRLLRRNPKNDNIRFKLTDELIKASRLEEAYQQLEFLGEKYSEDPKYIKKLEYVVKLREDAYTKGIEKLYSRIKKNPKDKKAVLKLAQYHRMLEEYDEATEILENYFELVPDKFDPKMKFEYAHILAWNRYFEEASEVLDELIEKHPKNLDYKLFRAQIAIWTEGDIDLAEEYINTILSKKPNNLDALVSKASLQIMAKDFDEAQKTISRAKDIDSGSNEVITIQSRLDFQIIRAEERKIYEILEEGQGVLKEQGCEEALPYYEEYLEKAEPNNIVKREYADILFCAKYYDEALDIYNEILEDGYDYKTELERGKLYYEMGDSVKALEAFKFLIEEEPEEFQPRLFLGDSYTKLGENDSALAVYDTLLTWEIDSMQTYLVEQRISWIPPIGLGGILRAFPSSIGFAPQAQFYSDNLSFLFTKLGGRLELGVFQYLTVGVSFYKATATANMQSLDSTTVKHVRENSKYQTITGDRTFTSFKGHIIIPFTPNLSLSVALGLVNTDGYEQQDETEVYIQYNNRDNLSASMVYYKSDANLILYSPYLMDYLTLNKSRLTASLLKFKGIYKYLDRFVFSSYFDYISVLDGNAGNNFQLRAGSQFNEKFSVGYEYFYQNFRYRKDYISGIYYSPQDFSTHSFWGDYCLDNKEFKKVIIGGKMGYAPQSNQLILEGHVDVRYRVLKNITIDANLSAGQSSQFYSSYRYFAVSLAAYWNIW